MKALDFYHDLAEGPIGVIIAAGCLDKIPRKKCRAPGHKADAGMNLILPYQIDFIAIL